MATLTAEVIDVLGGSRVVGPIQTRIDLANCVRAGFPYEAFEAMVSALSVTQAALAKTLMIQPRTLTRRKRSGRLEAEESDRLYRLARVFAHAAAVFGGEEKAAVWMLRANRALGDRPPLEYLDTDAGAQEVDDALGRIEYGIFA